MDELLDRIAASTDAEVDQLRVYADQLILRGDSLGELIVVATQRLARETPELARREAALIAEHTARLDRLIGGWLHPRYRWRHGFVDAIRVESGDAAFDGVPKLATEPAFRLLRRFELMTLLTEGRGDLGPLLAELATLAPRCQRLVEIVVRCNAPLGAWIDGPSDQHIVSPLYEAFPRLEVLELEGVSARLGAIALPELRRFGMWGAGHTDLRSIVAAQLPELADLELVFQAGLNALGDNDVAATFGPLMYRDFGPQLIALSLAPATTAAIDYVIDELPTCPLARHVTRLAFRSAPITEGHLVQLAAHAPRLRRIERLEVRARAMSAPIQKRMRKAFGAALVLV